MYSATLIGWQTNNPDLTGKTLYSSNLEYGTNAEAARTALIEEQGWDIYYDTPSGTVCGAATSRTASTLSENPFSTTSIYPTVTENSVIIHSGFNQSILVSGLNGKQIDQIEVKKGVTNFNLSSFEAGLYLFKTSQGEIIKVIKR